jgi:hypothetical protein
LQVVLEDDRITIDPFGNIDVNGLMKSLESHDRFEVTGQNGPLVMIWKSGKSVKIDLLETGLQVAL